MDNVVLTCVCDVEGSSKEKVVKHILVTSKAKPVSASSNVVKSYIDGWACRKNPSKSKCKGTGKGMAK